MHAIREEQEGPFQVITLVEEETGSWVKTVPERGGIIISFGANGKELFYLDPDTLLNPEANVRGGNPILFPICGQLENGEYSWNDETYRMKNHGLARTAAWEKAGTSVSGGKASLTLKLKSTKEMLRSFPFSFELTFTYELQNGALTIKQEYRNLSEEPMPMVAGFHPYFLTSEKNLSYETDAVRYYDYNDGKERPFGGRVDLEPLTEAVVLLGAQEPRISFTLPDRGVKVTLEYSELFRYIVLWSVKGKDFICVEPWIAKNGEFHRKEELQMVQPSGSLQAEFTIRAETI